MPFPTLSMSNLKRATIAGSSGALGISCGVRGAVRGIFEDTQNNVVEMNQPCCGDTMEYINNKIIFGFVSKCWILDLFAN